MACPEDSVDNCGCLYPSNTNCVKIKGITSNCLTINNGNTLTSALNKILDELCEGIVSPSGNTYTITPCDEYLDVTTVTTGANTDFALCFSDTFIERVEDIETSITDIESCLQTTVTDIITGTPQYLTLTNNGTVGDCGDQWRIDYNPSGNVIYDGIIHSDMDIHSVSAVGNNILKSWNNNYISSNLFSTQDEIRVVVEGDLYTSDEVFFEIFNPSTASVVYSVSNIISDQTSAYRLESTIAGKTIASVNGTAFVTTELKPAIGRTLGTPTNGFATSRGLINICQAVTGMDYTNLTIRVRVVSGTGNTASNTQKFTVEVRKKI